MQVLGKGANGGLIVLVDAASAAALQASVAALRGAAEAAQALSALIPETAAVAPAQAAKRKVSGKPKGRKGQTATASVPGSARIVARGGRPTLTAKVLDVLARERAPMAVRAMAGRFVPRGRQPDRAFCDKVAQSCAYLLRLGKVRRVSLGVYEIRAGGKAAAPAAAPTRKPAAARETSDEERIRLIADRQRALDREG